MRRNSEKRISDLVDVIAEFAGANSVVSCGKATIEFMANRATKDRLGRALKNFCVIDEPTDFRPASRTA
jgi:hypothetical protein